MGSGRSHLEVSIDFFSPPPPFFSSPNSTFSFPGDNENCDDVNDGFVVRLKNNPVFTTGLWKQEGVSAPFFLYNLIFNSDFE